MLMSNVPRTDGCDCSIDYLLLLLYQLNTTFIRIHNLSPNMSEEDVPEEYDASVDTELSGVRFATVEDHDAALDYNCERLYTTVQYFCGDKEILPPAPEPVPEDEEDPPDELEPLFESDDFPPPFIQLVMDNLEDIFKAENDQKIIDFLFNVVFSLLFENKETIHSNIEQTAAILSSQSDEFNKINLKLYVFSMCFQSEFVSEKYRYFRFMR